MNSYASIDILGTKVWRVDNIIHREDGPAIEFSCGEKQWWINDLLHREDGPAVESPSGAKHWLIKGERHREDGPAIEKLNGLNYWYINGEDITNKVEEDIKNGSLRPYPAWTEIDIAKFKLKYL